MNLLKSFVDEIYDLLIENNINEDIDLRISNLEDYDYQINNLVKYQKHTAIDLIKEKISELLNTNKLVKEFEFADNLFINLKINAELIINNLKNVENNISNNKKEKVIIDYGGPNIGKPLHVGHLRPLNIGRSIYNTNKIIGNNVYSDIHLGDWGMPVAQIIAYCELENINIKTLTAEKLIDIYPKSSSLYSDSEDFENLAKEKNKALNNQDKKVLEKWDFLKDISIYSIKEVLFLLGHDFDLWLGESDVNELIEPMIELLKDEGKVDIDDNALVSTQDSDPKILIAKSDGSYLYLTTDIATIKNRLENYDFDKTLYVVDARQKLHFIQLFQTIEYFNFPKRKYEHIEFGTINDKKGKPFKTRDGGTKKLLDLYEETFEYIKNINKNLDKNIIHKLTNTVLTYSDLLTNRKTDYKFDLKKFTNISGKTGIYVQYAQVRAKNIIKKSKNKITFNQLNIKTEDERNLTIELLNLELIINQSIKFNEPHHLANYLYEICNLFNIFYQHENILNMKNEEIKESKLLLTKYFLDTIQLCFDCLGIESVEKM